MDQCVIANVRVFDGVDVLPGRCAVSVSAGRIVEIAAQGGANGRGGADATGANSPGVIDGRGMTLMPGLIDAHFHCNSPAVDVAAIDRVMPSHLAQYARRYLEDMLLRGFTTLRDAGGADIGLVRALNEGLIQGPRLFVAGKAFSQSGGHGDFRPEVLSCGCHAYEGSLSTVVDGPDNVRVAVRNLLRTGAHQVKIMVSGGVLSPMDPIWMDQYTDAEITAAVEEAARWRTYVMAHSLTDSAARRCARLGVRSVEHGLGVNADTAKHLAEHGTFVVPTLGTPHWLLQGVVPIPAAYQEKLKSLERAGVEAIEHCAAAGVRLGFGTDLLGALHGREAHELVLRAEASGALEALRSATSVNAELMNLSGEIGRVALGAHADLLLVDGDPLKDIALLTRPEAHLKLIMLGGKIVANRLD